MVKLTSTGERVAAIYGATFFALGISLPYYPLLLADRGMGDTEIAVIIAGPMIVRAVVSSLLGMFADWIGDRRRVLILYSVLAALSFSMLVVGSGFLALFVITITTSLFANASTPVTDALATSIVRAQGGDYGRMRMWGSISFVAANLVGGVMIAAQSPPVIFWMLAGAYWAAVLVLVALAPRGSAVAQTPPVMSTTARIEAHTLRPHYMRDRVLIAGLVTSALIQASHAMVYSFSSLYWQARGFTGTEVGVFWGTGVVAEILMFYVSGRLFPRWGSGQMLLLSAVAAALRWLLFPLMPSFVGYLLLQCLHALTFACCHLAIIRLIVARAPDRHAASVQGLYTATGSLTMAAVTLASGPLYRAYGGVGFQLMALVVAVSVVPTLIWVGIKPQTASDMR